jgi:release factor glutamine methyltransferase
LPETIAGLTVHEALAQATESLVEAGCDTPRLDAELLLAFALAVERDRLVLDPDRGLDDGELERWRGLVARRVAREPLAYIVGRKAFRRITLSVCPWVLIPRPETELLVDVGCSLPEGARVVDVGTGSGAVALALKDERRDLKVSGTDIAARALSVARANARRLRLEVQFQQADLLDQLPGPFDAVLANLPYVSAGFPLPPEIALYEPRNALFAGPDGLALIRRLVSQLGGSYVVALEVGFDQAAAVAELLREAGWEGVETLRDLGGHERVVVGRR